MRRAILLAAPLLLVAHAAYPQAVVICPTCTQELPAVVNYAATLARWAQQAEQMREHYVQLVYTVESLKHLNPQSISTAAGLLANRLPGSGAADLPGYAYGSNLSGPGQRFYDQNTYYKPDGDDFAAQEMRRRSYATANLQGEAQESLAQIEERLAGLDELQASIPEQEDVQATSAINARFAAEKTFLANEQMKVANLHNMAIAQDQVDRQRAEQQGRQDRDDYTNALKAAVGW